MKSIMFFSDYVNQSNAQMYGKCTGLIYIKKLFTIRAIHIIHKYIIYEWLIGRKWYGKCFDKVRVVQPSNYYIVIN